MKHFWVIYSVSSVTLYYRNYSDFILDPDLVSGFLTALNYFSKVELEAHGINSINMGGLKWVYSEQKEMDLLLVAADAPDSSTEVMRSRLEVIYKMFVEKYNINSNTFKNSIIDQERYVDFKEVIDMLQDQWKQAELIISGGAAEIFDLMGVFQQIFNKIIAIVRKKFHKEKKRKIMKEIGMILNNLKETPEFKENPELSKISFSKHGWEVITMNPLKLDEEVLRRTLILITLHLNNILKANMKDYVRFNAFSKDIYRYFIEQYDLLAKLEVVHILLQIFIQ